MWQAMPIGRGTMATMVRGMRAFGTCASKGMWMQGLISSECLIFTATLEVVIVPTVGKELSVIRAGPFGPGDLIRDGFRYSG
jgi:hypothetical protein